MKKKLVEIKWKLVGILGKLLIDFIFSTSKPVIKGFEKVESIINSRNVIAAIWHSRILIFSYIYKGYNAAILVSQADDGEIIARILQKQGHETVRGSTTRGGLRALAGLVRRMKAGQSAVIIPDGPQGPRFKIQHGIITLAKKTGAPIIPMSYSAKRTKVFASWDRFVLPFPFNECMVVYGVPVYVPEDADRETEEKYRVLLEKELFKITVEADQYFGHDTP